LDAAEYRGQRRHDHVPTSEATILPKAAANHDADRQIDDAALHCKFFEF